MDDLLADKTAVVTGGSSGLGRAISMRFADHGADVVVADVQSEPREGGLPTHRKIDDQTGSEASFSECDVTDKTDLEAAVAAADGFGGVDVMVNNAGIYWLKDFREVTEEDFERMTAINQKGTFFGAQVAAERMVDDGGGSIINMSSMAGIRGFPASSVYCMTKAAVKLLSYSLAAELGPYGVRVNAIHPGTIRTTMTEEDEPHLDGDDSVDEACEDIALRRIGAPDDVAKTALYLASDLGSYINGESIAVDGGMVNLG
jgi:NAD(P)-dependent dehydrogenase (short-subunit alcohol dehydrogenase family)